MIKQHAQDLSLRRRAASAPASPTFLDGQGPARPAPTPPPSRVRRRQRAWRSTRSRPSDFGFYELLNDLVQEEPATALDPELMGQLAAIGIVKGKPFAPDERMRKILDRRGRRRQRHLADARCSIRGSEGFAYYPDSAWNNPLFVGGYDFETPIADGHRGGRQAVPADRRRTLDCADGVLLRRHRHHARDEHAAHRASGRSTSFASLDADENYFDGAQDLQGDAAAGHPGGAASGRSPLYDNQTRSMLADAAALSRAPAASPTRRRPRCERRRLDDRLLRSGAAGRRHARATGSRRCRARAGSRSCASTARSSRSSTRAGGRARSRW